MAKGAAVPLPAFQELSAKLQKMSSQLAFINAQHGVPGFPEPTYPQITAVLWCDPSGWYVRDFWTRGPDGTGSSGPFPQGFRTTGVVTPGMSASACDTLAQTMLTNIRAAFPNVVFFNV